MPEKRKPFVITALRVSGWATILVGVIQIIETFHLDTFSGVAVGILIVASSAVFFGLASILDHLHRQN